MLKGKLFRIEFDQFSGPCGSQEGETTVKRTHDLIGRWTVAMATIVVLLLAPTIAMAAPNTGIGDVAGVDADLTNSNTFNLSAAQLALLKRAYVNGVQVSNNDTVPTGTTAKFMIYMNNSTAIAVNDVTIQDVLANPDFSYTLNTIKVDDTQTCAGVTCLLAEEDTIFGILDAKANSSDSVGDDVASFDGTDTIDIGNANELTNATVNVPAGRVFAVLITVTVN